MIEDHESHGSDQPVMGPRFVLPKVALHGIAISFAAILFSFGLFIQFVWLPKYFSPVQVKWKAIQWVSDVSLQLETPRSLPCPYSVAKFSRYLAKKDFSPQAVLDKVAAVDQITLTHSSAQEGATEKRKLSMIHQVLTARFMIALNATAVPLSQVLAKVQVEYSPQNKVAVQRKVNIKEASSVHVSKKASRSPAALESVVEEGAGTIDVEERVNRAISWNPVEVPVLHEQRRRNRDPESPLHEREVVLADLKPRNDEIRFAALGNHMTGLARAYGIERDTPADFSEVYQSSLIKVSTQPDDIVVSANHPSNEQMNTQKSDEYSVINGMTTQWIAKQDIETSPVGIQALGTQNLPNQDLPTQNLPNQASDHTPGPNAAPTTIKESSSKEASRNALNEKNGEQLKFDESADKDKDSKFIEAFSHQPIAEVLVKTRMVTRESLQEKDKGFTGWQLATADKYWPTLSWTMDSESSRSIPLIPKEERNGFKMLATLASIVKKKQTGGMELASNLAQIETAGVVFGKVAPGWRVSFSGRAEAPVILNSALQLTDESDAREARFFVFLNAEPGAHIMTLSSDTEKAETGVVFPVLGGNATYLDLTEISKPHKIQGQVSEEVPGEPNWAVPTREIYQVSILGQPAKEYSYSNGSFRLDEVRTVGSYPYFLEVRDPENFEYPHRYKLSPDQKSNIDLIRISGKKLRFWVRKGPNGVSDENGVVVAAIPGLLDLNPKSALTTNLYSLYSSANFEPKVFTISPSDRPIRNKPLQALESRVAAFDVSTGPVVLEFLNELNEVVWSEMLMVSKGIVNIVGR